MKSSPRRIEPCVVGFLANLVAPPATFAASSSIFRFRAPRAETADLPEQAMILSRVEASPGDDRINQAAMVSGGVWRGLSP